MNRRNATDADTSGSGDAPGIRPRRLLLVELSQDGTVGGSHQCMINIARAMDRRRFTPIACFLEENAAADTLRRDGIETHVIEATWRPASRPGKKWIGRRALNAARHVRGLFVADPSLRAHLADWRVDILHQNNSVGLGPEWIIAAKSLHLPVVVHQRGYYFGTLSSRLVTDRKIDRVICISRSVESELRAATRLGDKEVRQLWDFVDADRFAPLPEHDRQQVRRGLGAGAGELLLGMVGNLKEWKGQHVVVEALALLPPELKDRMRCAFLGSVARRPEDAAYAERLFARVQELGLQGRVTFPGFQERMDRVYPALDLLIHASVTPEPFGMVIAEAMSCGTAVVCTRGGGPDDIVEDGRTGLAVEPGDPRDLARALERLLSHPAELRAMGEAARGRVLEHFSASVVMPRLERVYAEIQAGASGR